MDTVPLKPHTRPLRRRIACLAIAGSLLSGLALADLAHPAPASAATTGAGLADFTPDGGYLGNYIAPDGLRVYCIDSALAWPAGTTTGPELVDSVPTSWGAALSPEILQKLNYVLIAYGETADPVQAAAVAAYVYAYTSGWARDLGAGYAAGAYYLNGDPTVTARYDQIWSDAEAHAMPAPAASVSIEMADSSTGVVQVSVSPAEAVGTIHLDGAVVAQTGQPEAVVANGTAVPIRGVPADDRGNYAISAQAVFDIATPAAAAVILYATGDQQRTIRGGGTGSVEIAADAQTEAISLDFAAVIHTAVTDATIEPGEPFVDMVTATVADGSRPWRVLTDGSFVPVLAHGVLYGPLATQPALSATVPEGVPVAAERDLTLTGPGDYSAEAGITATAAGYYTWVWSIDASQQAAESGQSLPPAYTVTSEFGLAEETHFVTAPPAPAELAKTGGAPLGLGWAALLLMLGSGVGIVARARR